MNSRFVLAAACLTWLPVSAPAHNAWVVRDSLGYRVVYGHEELSGYAPSKLREVSAFDGKAKRLAIKTIAKDSSARLEPSGAPAFFLISFDNGFYTKTTEGTKNVSKKGVKDYLSAIHSVKFSKSAFLWNDKLLKPLGQKMEVVPGSNPLRLKPEDSLSVTVYFEGKPLPKASVNVAGSKDTTLRTDENGRAKVTFAASGPKMIVASWKVPLKDDPDADTLSYSGALFLDLKK